MLESALVKIFFLVIIFPYQAGRDDSPSGTCPVARGRWPSAPQHPCPAPAPFAPQGWLISLSSLPEFVFLLLWFSCHWYKQAHKSPAWLGLPLLWLELLVTSVRPEPSPPHTNPFKPGLVLPLEIPPWFCSIKPKLYQHTVLTIFLRFLT